jgi:hypothetical protein
MCFVLTLLLNHSTIEFESVPTIALNAFRGFNYALQRRGITGIISLIPTPQNALPSFKNNDWRYKTRRLNSNWKQRDFILRSVDIGHVYVMGTDISRVRR